jgi:hypothetical protein
MKADLQTEFNKACAKKLIAIVRALLYEQERRLLGDIANSLGYGGQNLWLKLSDAASSLYQKDRKKLVQG